MAKLISSIDEIIALLNGNDPNRPWYRVPGYSKLSKAEITEGPKGFGVNSTSKSTLLVVFVNSKTGEVRLFVAKWIEEEANKKLS